MNYMHYTWFHLSDYLAYSYDSPFFNLNFCGLPRFGLASLALASSRNLTSGSSVTENSLNIFSSSSFTTASLNFWVAVFGLPIEKLNAPPEMYQVHLIWQKQAGAFNLTNFFLSFFLIFFADFKGKNPFVHLILIFFLVFSHAFFYFRRSYIALVFLGGTPFLWLRDGQRKVESPARR